MDKIDLRDKIILIADDNPENIHLLINTLNKYELRIIIANNGIEVLERVNNIMPDLILLDVSMPEMDGFEACKQLKENDITKDIPVIFMTASYDIEHKAKGFNLGAVDYITKPFQHEEVLSRIKVHLTIRQLQTDLMNSNKNLEKKVKERTADLEKTLEEKNILLNEVHHRVNNNLNFLSALLLLQIDKFDKKTNNIFIEYYNRIHAVALIHRQMYKSKSFINIDLVGFIKSLHRDLIETYHKGKKNIAINIDNKKFIININLAIPCGLILNELISNAVRHAFIDRDDGIIDVTLEKDKDNIYSISIKDNGIGLDNDFNLDNKTTWGINLIKILLEQLSGSITYKNKNGSYFHVKFKETKLSTYNPV